MTQDTSTEHLSNLVIRASAGTGKTFQLSSRFLALLNRGVAPDRILATTFTRKAAAEILDRVVMRLADAALSQQACTELGSFLDDDSLECNRCRELLNALLRDLHRVRVSTLDSFFAQMARSLSLEIGLPLAWKIVDELQDSLLREEAIDAVIQREKTTDLLTLAHLLTKGEASRSVGQLIRGAINDLESLYQDSNAEAWRQIPRQKPLADDELVLTLEDLRMVGLPDGRFERARDGDYQRALLGDWQGFVTKGIVGKVAAGETTFYKKPIPDDAMMVYGRLLEHARAILVARVAMQTESSYELLAKFNVEYQSLKQDHRATRFADITRSLASSSRLVCERASTPPADRQFAYRLDGQIEHLLLDEFQDTAPAQWEILRPIADRVTHDEAGSLLCVGDTKQAIYGWRGGVAEIFDAVSHELDNLEARSLNTSFRSSPAVIETVNRVFTAADRHPNLQRISHAVRSWCGQFDEHTTHRSELPGYVSLVVAPSTDNSLSFAAEQIADVASRSHKHSIGVLVRRNATVGRLIGLLRHRGVAASEEGGNPLADTAAVQVILSLLRIADHSGDTVARFHVARSAAAKSLGLADFRDDKAARLLSFEIRRTLIDQGYGVTVANWASQLAAQGSDRERNRLEQLVELAFEYQSQATPRADDFVRYVEQHRVADPTTSRVRVMTVHQAKGLEFDVVVLPELDTRLVGQPDAFVLHRDDPTSPIDRICRYVNTDIQQLLPPRFQQMFQDATDRVATESLCVLYVALTRAIHALHMIIAPSPANERVVPQTYAGLLRAALRDNERALPGTTLYECGDPQWWKESAAQSPSETSVPRPLPDTIELAPTEANRRRGLERQSPSGLEGGSRVELADLFRTFNSPAMLRGGVVHTWFEQIEWLDEGLPDQNDLQSIARKLIREATSSLDPDELLADFRRMLGQTIVARTLSRAAYDQLGEIGFKPAIVRDVDGTSARLVVENERPFSVREGSQLLSGSIDRLVWIYSDNRLVAADIIDFKTDTVESDAMLAEKTAFYRPQLEAYRRAVRRMSGLGEDCIMARLLFVEPGYVSRIA